MDINNLVISCNFVTAVSIWCLQSTQVQRCPVDSRLNSQTVSPTHVQLAFSEEPSFSQAPLNYQTVSNGLCSSSAQASQVLCTIRSLGFGVLRMSLVFDKHAIWKKRSHIAPPAGVWWTFSNKLNTLLMIFSTKNGVTY